MFLCQVGDVVLVPDESVIDDEYKMIGLDTLVCFTVSCDFTCESNFYMIYWEEFILVWKNTDKMSSFILC
jgi:hypothetical protein